MPNEKQIEQRVRSSWRTRACAAGLCVGAQIYLSGCAVGMPLALGSAWLSSLPALAFALWICRRSCLGLAQQRKTRTLYTLLAVTLLLCGAFALVSLAIFAAGTLVEQASRAWTQLLALLACLLCALSGSTGAARLGFAMRYALPVLVLGLSLANVPFQIPVGLFPILGAGAMQTGLASLAMLFGAAPALMLMLQPPEIADAGERAQQCPIPPVRFFAVRVLLGAAAGIALLFLTCSSATYESIAESSEWSARLRMAAGNQPHEGIGQMLLITAKLFAMLLLAVNMICAGQQALVLAFPSLARASLWPALLLPGAALAAEVLLGDTPILLAAPAIAVPAALSAVLAGRRQKP